MVLDFEFSKFIFCMKTKNITSSATVLVPRRVKIYLHVVCALCWWERAGCSLGRFGWFVECCRYETFVTYRCLVPLMWLDWRRWLVYTGVCVKFIPVLFWPPRHLAPLAGSRWIMNDFPPRSKSLVFTLLRHIFVTNLS